MMDVLCSVCTHAYIGTDTLTLTDTDTDTDTDADKHTQTQHIDRKTLAYTYTDRCTHIFIHKSCSM